MAKILVVDDESQLIELVQMRLEASGHEVIVALDGQEGLEKAKNENAPKHSVPKRLPPKSHAYALRAGMLLKSCPMRSPIGMNTHTFSANTPTRMR